MNKFELLDALGADDFYTKTHDLFISYTFASNLSITRGICRAWKVLSDRNIKLPTREYFRPALQYMNALGGGILLDALNEEEIKNLFFDYVYQLYKKDKPNAIVIKESDYDNDNEGIDNEPKLQNEEIEKMQDDNRGHQEEKHDKELKLDSYHTIGARTPEDEKNAAKLNQLLGKPKEVALGCSVVLHKVNENRDIKYIIPKSKDEGQWYGIQKKLLNKTIGDKLYLGQETYIVLDISW